ncbi:MAG: MarC family protein [Ilumatobacteraceae bacterium]|jgi:multiple antibiotic resistance protein|nr:MarC family protein [Ilumatobacteraceae bacterium]MDA2959697.1 MarC family protein [Actinomycetota bacterium]
MNTVLFVEVLVTMAVIMDPIGNVPIFASVTRRLSEPARHRAAALAVVTAAIIIAVFAAAGQRILLYLDVSLSALRGAGGLLLLLVALELLTGSDDADSSDALDPDDHVAVAMVPLGTPLLAGPGAIVATIVFVNRADDARSYLAVAAGAVVVLIAVYLAMRFASVLMRVLRRSGVLLLSRVAGLLLAAIAVQMLADAVIEFARQV